MRCWFCGTEPDEVHEIHTLESLTPRLMPVWPDKPSDHQHAEHPPSPAQLEHAGHHALLRLLDGG